MIDLEISRKRPVDRLIQAVTSNNIPEIESALSDGASPNDSIMDAPPILLAIRREFLDVARTLINHGANVSLPNRQGWTALHEAATQCNVDAISILAEAEFPRWNKLDNTGWSPLRAAVESYENPSQLRAIRALINQNALPNMTDEDGITPLMRAVELRSSDVVELLMACGANATLKDQNNQSAQDRSKDWSDAPDALFQTPINTNNQEDSVESSNNNVEEDIKPAVPRSTIRKRGPNS